MELPGWPEGLSAELAAAYVGVSRTRFLLEVRRGVWHKPDKRGRRCVWSRSKLQEEIVSRYDDSNGGFVRRRLHGVGQDETR